MLVQDLEEFFHAELVKHHVNYNLAAKAAKILASGKPDELLTEDEKHLATEVCQQWSKQRQRIERFNSLL